VHAQFIGRLALIAFFIAEHGQDEDLLELTHRFGESHAISIHLKYKIIELRLHNTFSLLSHLHARQGRRISRSRKTTERGEENTRKEKAVTLVML